MPAPEEPYTIKEVEALMGFSRRTIGRIFENEPGVICIKRPETMEKRRYHSIRIPRHVYRRVVNRVSVPSPR